MSGNVTNKGENSNRSECDDIRSRLEAYLDGETDKNETGVIEKHIAACTGCSEMLGKFENIRVFNTGKPEKVYDSRKIAIKLTRKIVLWVIGVLCVIMAAAYLFITTLLPAVFMKSWIIRSDESSYAIKDLIQFAVPGSYLLGGNEGHTTMLRMIRKADFEQKTVGGGLKEGAVELSMPLYLGGNVFKFNIIDERQGNGLVFNFHQKRSGSSPEQVWKKIGDFGGGTRTIAALYFEESVSIREMSEMLEKVNANDSYTWLAVDIGDTIKYDNDIMHKPYRELSMFSPQWGFPMRLQLTPITADNILRDKDGRITSMHGGFKSHDVSYVADKFMKEMKGFEAYACKYFGKGEFSSDLGMINKYLADHGIQFL